MFSLALKYRPRVFEDVTGQSNAVISLKNAIELNSILHAYLFYGARGVGKTSMARILARSLNCKKGPTSSPCEECDNCQEISAGESPDVIEMDAASNRGIDHIRTLRENIRFTPMKSKYKIYIIDEVHMLSNDSFNALLKTLEEPPSHVIFIFATTEQHKIPETILSRCQNFSFGKFSLEEIIKRLEFILTNEQIEYERDALIPITQKAEGSMRDAISLLDQVLTFVGKKKITMEDVQKVLGVLPFSVILEILGAMRERHLGKILLSVQKIYEGGYNLKRFLWEVLETVKNAYLIKTGSYSGANYILPESQYDSLKKEADSWEERLLQTSFDVLYEVYSNPIVFYGSNSNEWRIELEMAFVKLFERFKQPSIAGLTQKIMALKNSLQSPHPQPAPSGISERTESPEKENKDTPSSKDTTPPDPPTTSSASPSSPAPQTEEDIDTILQKEFMGSKDHSENIVGLFEAENAAR